MPQNKKRIKLTIILLLTTILISHFFLISIAKTEVYFSLYDNPQKAIIANINQAQAFINIAMYTFTDKEIALALINARERDVKVRVYLDRSQVGSPYSVSSLLVQQGLKLRISTNNYIMHNKFAIIDNRLLLTGSYNWTFSANHRNDENLLAIDDSEVIKRYQNQFVNLWMNKYSLERTKELFNKAKVNILSIFPSSSQTETKIININSVSSEEFASILQISEPLAQKIIALREELGGFKEPQDLNKLKEITNLEWEEWKEEGIIITVD